MLCLHTQVFTYEYHNFIHNIYSQLITTLSGHFGPNANSYQHIRLGNSFTLFILIANINVVHTSFNALIIDFMCTTLTEHAHKLH